MAWYRAGTVSVTSGSPAVVGTTTAWLKNVQPGHAINLPDGKAYEVLSVDSDTAITLGSNYGGSTASGQAYSVQPNQGFAQYAAQVVGALITSYQSYLTTALAGRFPDGSAASPSITYTADQDTGFYRKNANTIGVTTGAADIAEFGGLCAFFSRASTEVGADLVGSSVNNNAYLRLLDNARAAVLGYFGWAASRGLDINSASGDCYISVPTSQLIRLRVAEADICRISSTSLRPGADNAFALGTSGSRFSVLYAGTGTINTSDATLKTWRGALIANELAAAKEIAAAIGIYQWNDEIVAKGPDGARLHCGVKAQQVISIMTAHGLDPMRYGFVCYDEWEETPATPALPEIPPQPAVYEGGTLISRGDPGRPEIPGSPAIPAGNRYGVRYVELSMFLAAAQEQRLRAIEETLTPPPAD